MYFILCNQNKLWNLLSDVYYPLYDKHIIIVGRLPLSNWQINQNIINRHIKLPFPRRYRLRRQNLTVVSIHNNKQNLLNQETFTSWLQSEESNDNIPSARSADLITDKKISYKNIYKQTFLKEI